MENNIKSIGFNDTVINNGFWHKRQNIIAETSVYSIWKRFKETGRFEAFNFSWKEGTPNKPHIFWDSDIAKWIETVAYIIQKKEDKVLEKAVDEAVDLIEKHQNPSGYINIYFTVAEPDMRWMRRTDHELYCAGHLIEAAVAYYNATGKTKFLNLMKKYANHIEKVFVIDKSADFITPGHEEIELALVKLYQCTKEKRYLELSRFFIDNRGKDREEQYYKWANSLYAQDHLPVRKQSTAEGHSVRAVYLYCGMADIAREYDDEELHAACRRIFENIVTRRMYITGGIGSSNAGEAFTIDYDLPNLIAYSESCAAIGLALFAGRMLLTETDSIYADAAEKVFYNGLLSSISLDGKAFFYENPLEVQPLLKERDVSVKPERKGRLPLTQRKEIFGCSCCPPNISRFIASIGDFLYTYNSCTIFVHHYMPSTTVSDIDGKKTEIIQRTNYPSEGNVSIVIKGKNSGSIALRIPGWCKKYGIEINGTKADVTIKKGYAYLNIGSQEVNNIEVKFEIKPQLIEASPNVQENSGRVALQRGPVVYCLEAVDNGNLLKDVRISPDANFEVIEDSYFGLPVIRTVGHRRDICSFGSDLYRPVYENLIEVGLKFIPYFGFANRGESEMVLWVLKG